MLSSLRNRIPLAATIGATALATTLGFDESHINKHSRIILAKVVMQLTQVPCTRTLFLYPVPCTRTLTLYPYPVPLPCTRTLYSYPVPVHCPSTSTSTTICLHPTVSECKQKQGYLYDHLIVLFEPRTLILAVGNVMLATLHTQLS